MQKHLSLILFAITLLLVATLHVQGQQLSLRSTQTLFTGETAEMGCVIDTSPEGFDAATEPFNAWTKDSEVIDIILGGRISLLQLSTSSILTIRNIEPSDEGVYVCSRPGFQDLTHRLNVITGVRPGGNRT